MGKRVIAVVLAGAISFASADATSVQSEQVTTADYSDFGTVGAEAANRAINMSMFGWGLALAIGITIIALVVPSSTGT
ncbi:MAG: hypothetical protein P0S94_03790 [Simkaniaceae bacterium]|nr:hypothetical protein [Simkaniaceae bacterium]